MAAWVIHGLQQQKWAKNSFKSPKTFWLNQFEHSDQKPEEITTAVGTGSGGYSGDNGPASRVGALTRICIVQNLVGAASQRSVPIPVLSKKRFQFRKTDDFFQKCDLDHISDMTSYIN